MQPKLFCTNNNNNSHFTALCPGLTGWTSTRRTFAHTHLSSSSTILYQLPLSTTIRNILSVQFTCLTVFFCTTSLQVLFGQPLGLEPSTSYSIHFFTQSLSMFRKTCWCHRNLFCCSTEIMSSNPSPSLNSLVGTLSFTLMSHIHLTILISACWSATSFPFLTGQVSLPCNILLCTQLVYSVPHIIRISILISNGTNCLNLYHPIGILASTAASASLLGWSLKLKFGKSKLQTLKFVGIVEKTLLVNFFLNRTTFTLPHRPWSFMLRTPRGTFCLGLNRACKN